MLHFAKVVMKVLILVVATFREQGMFSYRVPFRTSVLVLTLLTILSKLRNQLISKLMNATSKSPRIGLGSIRITYLSGSTIAISKGLRINGSRHDAELSLPIRHGCHH